MLLKNVVCCYANQRMVNFVKSKIQKKKILNKFLRAFFGIINSALIIACCGKIVNIL